MRIIRNFAIFLSVFLSAPGLCLAEESGVTIIKLEAVFAVTKRVVVKFDQLDVDIPKAIEEVDVLLKNLKEKKKGAPFARLIKIFQGELVFDVGFPVTRNIVEMKNKNFQTISLYAGKVAKVVHHGPYSTLHKSHRKVYDWVNNNHVQLTSHPWIVYAKYSKNVDQIRTEIYYPIK